MQVNKSDIKRQAILETAYRLFRVQGFDKTSMDEITAQVGGSKSTVYSHFPSKEGLFVECMMAALENYMSGTLKYLDASRADPRAALLNFGSSVLKFICSPEQLEVRRLIIAEAARSGTGKLFFGKLSALRVKLSAFLAECMASGKLRHDDPDLAAEQLGAMLEAEMLEPLLLQVREGSPDEQEIALAAQRAVATFLRAYAPNSPQERQSRSGRAAKSSVRSAE
ncbi:MAG TPA: TetR/AcrR family transcriptional regulator [Steroidobacteraceae bacterium]|nr:TetR/AcrR family transcriptional regulator [Steroidobacteraceae bacterium]